MMARTNDDLAFLRAYLDQLQKECDGLEIGESSYPEFNGTSNASPVHAFEVERCARLADALGFDGNIFRSLYDHQVSRTPRAQQHRISFLNRLILELESRRSVLRQNIDLTNDHVQILRFLAQQKVLTKQLDIEIAVQRCRKTVGKRLRELRSYGLVVRPRGQRTGETITDAGRRLLGEL